MYNLQQWGGGVWMYFWGVRDGSQQNPLLRGHSAALRTCRMCKNFGARKKLTARTLFFSVFLVGVSRSCAVGVWGTAGDLGWKRVFQLDTFHGCFGKRWWKLGGLNCPFTPPHPPLWGSSRCQSKQRRRGRASPSQHRMSPVSLALTSVKTSLPQSFAAALPLQVRSMTPQHRATRGENVPMWQKEGEIKGRVGMKMISC